MSGEKDADKTSAGTTPQEPPRTFSCKFVSPDDTDERNELLRRPVRTLDEWVESVSRCTDIVEQRLNDIERRIREGETS